MDLEQQGPTKIFPQVILELLYKCHRIIRILTQPNFGNWRTEVLNALLVGRNTGRKPGRGNSFLGNSKLTYWNYKPPFNESCPQVKDQSTDKQRLSMLNALPKD